MPGGPAKPGRDESLSPPERLRRRDDYHRCYRKGQRKFGKHLTLFFVENQIGHPRLGMTVSRKVGGAVTRVKLKRRFREIYRRWPQRKDLPPLDLVIHAQPSSAPATFSELESDLTQQLRRATRSFSETRRSD
ncbi:MAG: ribonuclease P protein component [Thermoanaerobaculia bacterium]